MGFRQSRQFHLDGVEQGSDGIDGRRGGGLRGGGGVETHRQDDAGGERGGGGGPEEREEADALATGKCEDAGHIHIGARNGLAGGAAGEHVQGVQRVHELSPRFRDRVLGNRCGSKVLQ